MKGTGILQATLSACSRKRGERARMLATMRKKLGILKQVGTPIHGMLVLVLFLLALFVLLWAIVIVVRFLLG